MLKSAGMMIVRTPLATDTPCDTRRIVSSFVDGSSLSNAPCLAVGNRHVIHPMNDARSYDAGSKLLQ